MKPKLLLIGMLVFLMGLPCVQAGMYDLVTNTEVTVNDAVFIQSSRSAAGSGNIQSFLRIQNSPVEEGINFTNMILDTKPGAFLSELDVRYITQVTYNFNLYREFFIDLSESGDKLVSLDSLKIYVEPSSGLTAMSQLTNEIYNLGTDNWLKIYGGGGNGIMDVRFLIPDELFGDSGYLYLYAKLGTNIASDDGFEEFDVDLRDTPIPEPASILLFGLAGLFLKRRT